MYQGNVRGILKNVDITPWRTDGYLINYYTVVFSVSIFFLTKTKFPRKKRNKNHKSLNIEI